MHERMTTTCYNGYEDLFLENRLECEIIPWKNITHRVIKFTSNTKHISKFTSKI